MAKKGSAALTAAGCGALCVVILVTLGRLSGSPTACWTVAGVFCLTAAAAICWDHPGSFWFTGPLMSGSIWLLAFLGGGWEVFQEHLGGLTMLLVLAFLGAAGGAVHPHRAGKAGMPSTDEHGALPS
jgi:hypothetical protein